MHTRSRRSDARNRLDWIVLHKAFSAAVIALIALMTFVGIAVSDRSPTAATRHGWAVVFEDDFPGRKLDYAKWNARDNASTRNNELQYYSPNNITVTRNRLELHSVATTYREWKYTSGAVDTYQKFSFTYGRVEVRARLPEMGPGIWPAIWLLGDSCHPTGHPCSWPTVGATEIDLMEAVNTSSTWFVNAHYGHTVGQTLSPVATELAGRRLAADFHDYALEWEPGGVLRWYLDGDLVAARVVPEYFESPMYLMINTAVGGDWPGSPTAETTFPQRFDIDVVRVLQRP